MAMSAERPNAESRAFPRGLRLLRKADFERVLRRGVRCANGTLVVWLHPNGLDRPRFGLIVSRRHGGAVQRNRQKRVLREAFRHCWRRLPAGCDLVCSPQPGVPLTLRGAIECLPQLGARARRRTERRSRDAAPPETGSGPQA